MKASRLAVVFAAAFVVALVRCGGNNTPGDAGTRDSGTGNVDSGNGGQDSGTGSGTDAGNGTDAGSSAGLGNHCNGTTSCPNTLACAVQPGATGGVCTESCAAAACPAGANCFQQLCFTNCDSSVPDVDSGCAAQQVCVPTSNTSNLGGCLPDCRAYPDECNPDAGSQCDPSFGICQPLGTQAFGQACNLGANPPVGCQQGLSCISINGGNTSFCSASCLTAQCPGTPSGAQCLLQNPKGAKFCDWLCNADGGCPSGLTCNGQICG